MSIEIKNLSIKSSVVQRQASGPGEEPQDSATSAPLDDWRAECRRMILELLDARRER